MCPHCEGDTGRPLKLTQVEAVTLLARLLGLRSDRDEWPRPLTPPRKLRRLREGE